MDSPDNVLGGAARHSPGLRAAAQSASGARSHTGNFSARRSPHFSDQEPRPHSFVGTGEGTPLQCLQHRSSSRNESISRQNGDNATGIDSHPGTGSLGVNQNDQSPGLNFKANGHPALIQEDVREPSDDASSFVSVRSEQTYLQRRDLGMLDVAALIINKQIGTGIFTTPGLVLGLTGNKTISIVMWFCGGIWAFLSVIIYVEFGSAFPFNGGELIYLDEFFRSPELLATVLFSAFFITVPNTDGNSIQFALNVLLTANPDATDTTQLDRRLIIYVAITILTVVCFIHYFSRNSGLLLNLMFAVYKVILVTIFIICGCIASSKPNNGKSDWGDQPIESKDVLGAMIFIIYSYQGWENANYVGGELKIASRDLKWGAFLAIGIVTLLYTLVTIAYSLACTFDELVGQDLGIISNFAPKAFGSSGSTGIKVCIALSALGNLIAVAYTSSKVKQQIARQCIIPFYKFFARDDKQFKTPAGALILHWVFAVVWIIATPNTSDGYGFIIGLFIYGQLIVGVFMGVAFFWIRHTYEADNTRQSTPFVTRPVTWRPVILKSQYLRVLCALLFIGVNIMVLIQSARSSGDPPPWAWPVVIFGLLLVVFLYWLGIVLIAEKSNEKSPLEIRIVRDGITVKNPLDLPVLEKAKTEGNSRVVIYEVHGRLKKTLESLEVFLHQVVKLVVR